MRLKRKRKHFLFFSLIITQIFDRLFSVRQKNERLHLRDLTQYYVKVSENKLMLLVRNTL